MRLFRPAKRPPATCLADVYASLSSTPTFESNHLQAARYLRSGRTGHRVVHMPSYKSGAVIELESRLEFQYAVSREIDWSCQSYRAQPFSIIGPTNREMTADFVELAKNGAVLVTEVKPAGMLRNPTVQQRLRYMRSVLSTWGVAHQVVTDLDLEPEPRRSNRRAIYRGLHVPSSIGLSRSLQRMLHASGRISVADARNHLRAEGFHPHGIERGIADGLITFDWRRAYGEATTLVRGSL